MVVEQRDLARPAPVRTHRGCLFWAVVLAAAVAAGGYLVHRHAIGWIVVACTETAPLDIGETALSPADLGALNGRLVTFAHSVRNKTRVEPLVLTGEELTALVSQSPEFRRLGGRARFSVGNGDIHGQFSLPLARMGYPDRWFNGAAAFAVRLENGVLILTLRSASIKGEPVPGGIVWMLRNWNPAKTLYEEPLLAGLIARLESIEVSDGRITVVPRLRR